MSPKTPNGIPVQNENGYYEEEVVISGMSGRFPECENVEEFKQKLFSNEDMVTTSERRWPPGLWGVPERIGTLKDLSHFDAEYFEINSKQADKFDPQLRILLEVTHEAIADAGINPRDIRGTKTGVIVGCSASETREYFNADPDTLEGYALIGCFRSNFSNLISQFFDFKGLSFTLDTACSSGLYCLHIAVEAIKSGQCDAFVICGANLCLKPSVSLQFTKLRMTTQDGKCKSFDASGDGYVRAETVSAVFIQKSKDAKRLYATILGTKVNTDGYKEQGIGFPAGTMQLELMKQLYSEKRINPADIQYVEAHGTGTSVGDPQEVNALTEIMCVNRKEPLLIGSVKSNMGHAEAGAGLCSLTKVCLSMEEEVIPANLHFKIPNPDIPAVLDGRIKVVTKNQPWNPKMIGVSSFGFGGANGHCILRANLKKKVIIEKQGVFPYVCGVSGRTEKAVQKLLDKVKTHKDNSELWGLIHNLHKTPNPGHEYRGYIALTNPASEEILQLTDKNRPIWFAYTGLGAQWTGMGKEIMKIDICKKSIDQSAKILKQNYGFDLYNVLLTNDEEELGKLESSLAATAAIQLALTDLLKSLNIHPDGVIGHSAGEVGAAYADGAVTAEQAIQCSFVRGKAVQDAYEDNQVSAGAMAAIGLTWEEAKRRCPEGIYPACHNSEDNCTISGYPEKIQKFVSELQSEGIFAKAVNSCNLAFHCPIIKKAEPRLRKFLNNILVKPKARTNKWISTSVSQEKWDTDSAQHCSPDYQINNMFGPVLFYEGLQHVPSNAIVIEISPSGLLSGIIKRSLTPTNTVLTLMKRKYENNIEYLTQQLGKLYINGGQPHLEKLYEPVSFPVSRGTPRLGSDIEWDHSLEWSVANFAPKISNTGEKELTVDMKDNAFIKDHRVDGKDIYPLTGLLFLVWKTLAGFKNIHFELKPVEFKSIKISRPVFIQPDTPVKVNVTIYGEDGDFVLKENGSLVCKGQIKFLEEPVNIPNHVVYDQSEEFILSKEDIYKMLILCGYEYGGSFLKIKSSNDTGTVGELDWDNNWVTFIDAMIQFTFIDNPQKLLRVPVEIKQLVIDPQEHLSQISGLPSTQGLRIENNTIINEIKSGGILIKGLKVSKINKQKNNITATIQRNVFVSYNDKGNNGVVLKEDDLLLLATQTVVENSPVNFEILEVIGQGHSIISSIKNAFDKLPSNFNANYNALVENDGEVDVNALKADDIKIYKNLSEINDYPNLVILPFVPNEQDIIKIKSVINEEGFILIEENGKDVIDTAMITKQNLVSVAQYKVSDTGYILLRILSNSYKNGKIVEISEENFSWISELQDVISKNKETQNKIYIVSRQEKSGITGLLKVLRLEYGAKFLRSLYVPGKKGEFVLNDYAEQLKKDLIQNVLINGAWGSYKHLDLDNFDNTKHIKYVENTVLDTLHPEDISSLSWIEKPLNDNSVQSNNFSRVVYSSLNDRDLLIITGKLSIDKFGDLESNIGIEFSGYSKDQKRVMGLTKSGSIATTVEHCDLVWDVPDDWSLEEAATVPFAYTTAYYALVLKGNLQPGESVLIHSGASAVGQAAIKIALSMGCRIYTTDNTKEKRVYIGAVFPQILKQNIEDTSDFEKVILTKTNGKGVDLIFNCLSDDVFETSINCLAERGRFLEIGKANFAQNLQFEMNAFTNGFTFYNVLTETLFEKNSLERQKILTLLSEGIQSGIVTPLPTIVFHYDEVIEAFRLMSTNTHIGKILIKIQDENFVQPVEIPAISRVYFDPKKTYILIGGLGGIGLEFTNWLISRKASKILITSRKGIKNGYQHMKVKWWKQQGIQVLIENDDVRTIKGAENLIQKALKLGPVGGIFNLAMVLNNHYFINQSPEYFKETIESKFSTSQTLDIVSRKMVPDLDYFVMFSTIVAAFGNPGQSPYAMGSSAVERLIDSRKAANFSALAIQWGPVSDVGYINNKNMDLEDLNIAGALSIPLASYEAAFDIILQDSNPVLAFFHKITKTVQSDTNVASKSLIETIGEILGLRNKNYDSISKTATLVEFGLDSFMTQEIQQLIDFNYSTDLTLPEVRSLTFQKISEIENEYNNKHNK